MNLNEFAASIRQKFTYLEREIARVTAEMANVQSAARSPIDEINAIPGRRFPFHLVQMQAFDADSENTRGAKMTFKISADGPFIMTHYPLLLWRPTLPTDATNYLKWRPVYHTIAEAEVDTDFISMGYEMSDGGAQMNFQDDVVGPLISTPERLQPLPTPAMFSASGIVEFTPRYYKIDFTGATAPTEGTLHVTLIGYRIFNR